MLMHVITEAIVKKRVTGGIFCILSTMVLLAIFSEIKKTTNQKGPVVEETSPIGNLQNGGRKGKFCSTKKRTEVPCHIKFGRAKNNFTPN